MEGYWGNVNKIWLFHKLPYIYNKTNKNANEKFTYHSIKRVGNSWGYFLCGDGVIDYAYKILNPSPKEVGFLFFDILEIKK
jgi:hypothetical protein